MSAFKQALSQLSSQKHLSYELAQEAMLELLSATETEIPDEEIAKFIIGLAEKGEQVEEVAGLLDALTNATNADNKITLAGDKSKYIDTCGTGGDKQSTLNISTLAGLVVASAWKQTGIKVVKHGNVSVSSQSGSADVLQALGVNIHLSAKGVSKCVEEVGFGFCFARYFHPSFARVAKVRKQIAETTQYKQTIFNVLGPLANPASVQCQLLGVSNPKLAELLAAVLSTKKLYRGLVVYGELKDNNLGLDEISTLGTTHLIEVKNSKQTKSEINPEELNIDRLENTQPLKVSSIEEATKAAKEVLQGTKSPALDIVALNAGAAFYISGAKDSIKQGYEFARLLLEEKKPAQILVELIEISNQQENHKLAPAKS